MELRVLQYFLTVLREESITKAAEVLHITQPTLSRQLAQLEEEMGVRLFHRGARKITPTSEGLLLRRRAEEILDLAEKTSRELREQDEDVEGTVSIGSGEMLSMDLVADLCASFQVQYPRVRFDLYTATSDILTERMEHGSMDVGLLLEPIDMSRFEFIRLQNVERWAVLMRADDPLAKESALTAAQLEHLPLILPRRLHVQSELANWFGPRFQSLNVKATCNLRTNATYFVRKGLGYAVTLEGPHSGQDTADTVFRPLSPPLTANTALAWKRGQPFSKAVEKFISHAKCFLGMGEHEE